MVCGTLALSLHVFGVNRWELTLAKRVNLKSSIFGFFVAKTGPETHPDRPGSSYSAGCTENLPGGFS